VADALRALAGWPRVVLLDSAMRRPGLGRYSFLSADPFEVFEVPRVRFGDEPLRAVADRLARFPSATLPELPPLQGGAVGVLGYELGMAWERIARAGHDEFRLPDLAIGLYDWGIVWDHDAGRAWLVSHGWPETDPARRTDRAAERARAVREALAVGSPPGEWNRVPAPLPASRLAPQFSVADVAGVDELTSDFSREGYLRAVGRVIEYIRAGDIFQANLSQRLLAPQRMPALELYLRLRRCNPATFAGLVGWDDWAVLSASPERFLRVADGLVETRPIKGTRRRRRGPEADLFTGDELRESEKDQAENLMIVDLLRNDLSRVCQPGTLRVPQLCAVETYETVLQLVSVVQGRLRPGPGTGELLRAAFPGGSITGAPKVRAMEVIAELEPTARGPYCGSLLHWGFDGTADSNILIRTFVCRQGWVQCSVGGGIVAQSDPLAEYDETWHKAAGMLEALRGG
jgi:para-aminobenzoate synthetase component 1